MKKLSVKNLLLLLIAYFCISCELQIESDVKEELSGEFKIEVIDAGFGNVDSKADTKTEEQGYKTNFSQGDEIGVFIINTTKNSIEYNNEKITFDGVSWSGDLRDKGSNMKFYAYYPYDEDININSVTGSNVESFFSSYVGTKQLVTDQSDYSDYTKADIMVGEGTIANNIVTFEMKHQMSLVVIKLPSEMKYITEYYLKSDNDYRWQRYKMKEITSLNNIYFSGNIPYAFNDGSYRFIVPTTFSGCLTTGSFSANNEDKIYSVNSSGLNAGFYKEYNITVTSAEIPEVEHTLAIGDIFKSDGGLISQAELKSPGITDKEKKECVGIVFKIDESRIGTEEKSLLSNSYHGLVMALKDASLSEKWCLTRSNSVLQDTPNFKSAYNDISGLANCNKIWALNGYQTSYPAFNIAKEYNIKCPVSRTTGWFLPSYGQWCDIIEKLGGYSLSAYYNSVEKVIVIQGVSSTITDNIMSKLQSIGQGYYNPILTQTYCYWSSTELDTENSRHIDFNKNNALTLYCYYKDFLGYRVRCILAF